MPPIVIAHRGASGYRPEHTLASYALAIEMGADFIEPDLVMTRDGVLIARHEPLLAELDSAGQVVVTNTTTDIATRPEFADRLTTHLIDGQPYTGWFACDCTLEEVKSLRAIQRLPFRDRSFDGQLQIPTFAEVINLAKASRTPAGRPVGIYPETKHPTFHDSLGLPIDETLVKQLKAVGWATQEAPVFVQSFEIGNLRKIRKLIDVRLVQLMETEARQPFDRVAAGHDITYGQMLTPTGLRDIATYANAIGPYKRSIVPATTDNKLLPPTSLIADAHAAGLLVHPYTFRNEEQFLAADYTGDPAKEYKQFFELGVDGVFSDFPDTAIRCRGLMSGA